MNVRIIKPEITKRKKKVCAYARVSSVSVHQGESLENQIEYYKRKISANPDYELVDIFYDRAFTGTTEKRPGFKVMIKLCREGAIDLIYTKSVSRFARNKVIVLKTVRELKAIGVSIIFEQENIDTLSSSGELMLSIIASLAEEESRSASENIKWRNKKKFENGELIINTTRFLGYDKDENGNLIINLYESMIVKKIFHEYLKGNGAWKIANILNDENLPTVSGRKWGKSSILKILKNEKYIGDAVLQKTYTENHLTKKVKINNGELNKYYIENNHPAIIPREYWDKVQVILQMKKEKMHYNIEENKKKNPLIGMIFCGKCGSAMGKDRLWWSCNRFRRGGKSACSGTSIRDSEIKKINISEPTIIMEVQKDGKKCYYYSSKGE